MDVCFDVTARVLYFDSGVPDELAPCCTPFTLFKCSKSGLYLGPDGTVRPKTISEVCLSIRSKVVCFPHDV